MNAADAGGRRGRTLGLGLVSAAVLLLQLVQTRLFSVMLWHHLTYLVVTFTLLGFAAGGALLACRAAWLTGDNGRRLAGVSVVFGLSVLAAYALVTRHPPETSHSSAGIATAALSYALLVVPMVFAGLVVALCLADAGPAVGRLYAVNMVGSALGALLYVPALRALGGEGTVLAACALAFLGAASFARGAARGGASRLALGALLALAAGLAAFRAPTSVFEVPPAESKAMVQQMLRDPRQRIELTAWDPLCRIDVIGPGPEEPSAPRTIYQDGDASTVMLMGDAQDGVDIFNKDGLGYLAFRDRAPKVLAIGIGGGLDILQARATKRPLPEGQRIEFTGVEINATTYGLLTGPYYEATGRRYTLPGTRVVLDEGRSWLRRSDELYDIIQMTGTDTYAALASGSYVMSESYLYTAEAYDDFLDHLTPDGVISVLRFRFDPPRETLRLAAIAVDALRRDGASDPAEHVIMLGFEGNRVEIDGQLVGMDFGALLFRKRPWRPDEVALYERYDRNNARAFLMYAPGVECRGPVADYFAAVRAGTDAAFRASYVYNLDAVTDDKPFFFRFDRWDEALARLFGGDRGPRAVGAAEYTGIVGGEPIGLIMLSTVLAESLLLVLLLVLGPLVVFRRAGLAVKGAGRWVLYFTGLGAGYILLEVVAMQRFVLFVGNPGYALVAVLVTFLLFSGLGAAVAGRSADPRRTAHRALLGIIVLVAVLGALLPRVFAAALHLDLPVRLGITVLLLAPPAFLMGMPFPSGLALVSRRAAGFVPWACGVNGGASVIASVTGILIAMAWGFSAVFVVAGACYALALVAARGARA